MISARGSWRHGFAVREKGSGTPMSSTMITETVAVIRESFRACSAPAPVRTSPASAHGARITSPTRGKTKNSKATAAGTASSNGTRLCQGGGSVVRAPAARLVAGLAPLRVGSESGLGKARLGQHRLALRRENVVHKGLRHCWVL